MQQLIGQTMLLYFLVDMLLLMGANRFCGDSTSFQRAVLAALYGSLYAGACLLPELAFLTGFHWRFISLILSGIMTFLGSAGWVAKCLIYFLLQMAISGIVQSAGMRGVPGVLLATFGVFVLCAIGIRETVGKMYLPVELTWGDRKMKLTALRDTGNHLRDPVTGRPVLVVDAVTAEGLVGLSPQQLSCPLETITMVPGLRLIPYKTIGNTGFLLAMRMSEVRIGSWRGSSLVAFSPEVLSADGMYQALTGGNVQ